MVHQFIISKVKWIGKQLDHGCHARHGHDSLLESGFFLMKSEEETNQTADLKRTNVPKRGAMRVHFGIILNTLALPLGKKFPIKLISNLPEQHRGVRTELRK